MRWRLASALVPIAALGIATKFYTGPGAAWVGGHAGGILYVVFWVLAVLFLWPGLRPWRVVAGVFAVTCVLELLQLWHPAFLEGVRSTFWGHALIGSVFAFADLPYYALGGALAGLGVRALGLRGRVASAPRRDPGVE